MFGVGIYAHNRGQKRRKEGRPGPESILLLLSEWINDKGLKYFIFCPILHFIIPPLHLLDTVSKYSAVLKNIHKIISLP